MPAAQETGRFAPRSEILSPSRDTLPSFQKLPVVRRCVREGIIEATAIPLRGVHKSVEIFLDIDRLEEQAFVTNLLGVFDQNSCGAIDAPHPKSRPKKSAVRVEFFQTRHRMETIDCDSILAGKAVIGSIIDSSSVEQLLPFHGKIKSRLLDLVGSPHADGIFFIHRELQCLVQLEVSPDGDRTFVQFRKNAAAEAIENTQMRIGIKIVRHPTDCKCLKIPVLVSPSSESRCQAGRFAVAKHAYHRDERVRQLRLNPSVLVSERNNKIAVLCIYALSQARCNLGFDAVDDLLV